MDEYQGIGLTRHRLKLLSACMDDKSIYESQGDSSETFCGTSKANIQKGNMIRKYCFLFSDKLPCDS